MDCLVEFAAVVHELGEGVARRGGLHRRNEVSTMEVRSLRTPQPERDRPATFYLVRIS